MQQWQYRVINLEIDNQGRQIWSAAAGQWGRVSLGTDWTPVLEELGGEGWELAGLLNLSARHYRFVFKRPKP